MLKLKMMLRDDVAAGRRRLHVARSVSQCVKPPPPAWMINLPNWPVHLADGIISPQREADHYAKTTGRNPEVY